MNQSPRNAMRLPVLPVVKLTMVLIVLAVGLNNCGKKPKESTENSAPQRNQDTLTVKPIEYYSEDDILQARKKFKVSVIDFDATSEYGTEFPYSDRLRLRITNNSNMVLSYLTILTKRFNDQGKMIGSSRAPSISASNIKPGESLEYEYYPRGHLPGVQKIQVEIEHIIDADAKQFFKELSERTPKAK